MRWSQLIGGLVAGIGGGLVLIQVLISIQYLDLGGAFLIAWGINLAISIAVLIISIAVMAGKGGGGYILAMGIISIVLAIVSTMSIDLMFVLMQFSFLGTTLNIGPIWVITVEAILIVCAGIVSVVGPPNQNSVR